MVCKGSSPPLIVWASCFLWFTSMFAIIWSLLLFFCVGDILIMTGTDLVNALVLLSGLVMLPTNVQLLYFIANCKPIDHNSRVTCCPLWMCLLWIIVINVTGAVVCIQKICICKKAVHKFLYDSMVHYRSVPKNKHFMDNIQWSLGCCGLNSYKDWFTRDWYDKMRDYEWDPSVNKRNSYSRGGVIETDSVPLSCCKSGSCISNFLSELGTSTINTSGCNQMTSRLVMMSLVGHLIFFLVILILQVTMVFITVANWIRSRGPDEFWRKRRIFRLSSHFVGRRRNCYSIALRNVHRALAYATKARKLKKQDMKDLWNTRITAACEQHNVTAFTLKEGLDRANIMLNRKSLSDLAAWEPRTFECLAAVAKQKLEVDGLVDTSDKNHSTGINLNLKDVMLEEWLKVNKK